MATNEASYGFFSDGTNYTTVISPANIFTMHNPGSLGLSPIPNCEITGYSDGVIAGNYWDTNGNEHGFLYDGTIYTELNNPAGIGSTTIASYSDGIIAGNYSDTNGSNHGFLYDGTNYTPIRAALTQANALAQTNARRDAS